MMKVRIKEYMDGTYIRYKVQYRWFGIFWREYYDYFDKYAAIRAAKELEPRDFPRYGHGKSWRKMQKLIK